MEAKLKTRKWKKHVSSENWTCSTWKRTEMLVWRRANHSTSANKRIYYEDWIKSQLPDYHVCLLALNFASQAFWQVNFYRGLILLLNYIEIKTFFKKFLEFSCLWIDFMCIYILVKTVGLNRLGSLPSPGFYISFGDTPTSLQAALIPLLSAPFYLKKHFTTRLVN